MNENQLIRITEPGAWKSEFGYDGKMRSRVRKEFTWSGSWTQTNEVRYVYDGNLIIQERATNNQPQVTYTRGKDLSGSQEGAGGIGGLLARFDHTTFTPQQSTSFYHSDGKGNVTALMNTNQMIVARYEYDPFGNLLSLSGPLSEANSYRFSSKEFHAQSDLVRYLFRNYQPNIQRWCNRDPLRELGFTELSKCGLRGGPLPVDRSQRIGSKHNFQPPYVFAFNNPVNRIDPKGLDAPACDGIPDGLEFPCLLECCARHDECFDEHTCTATSWFCPFSRCGVCNIRVVVCVISCAFHPRDDPDKPNYYCCQCHEYFDLDDPGDINDPNRNPHFGHGCRHGH
jgi:RHS repeat-associated protein